MPAVPLIVRCGQTVPPREPRCAVKQRVPFTGTRRGPDRLKQLPHDSIGKPLLKGDTTGGQHAHAVRSGRCARGAEDGGLTDSPGPLH